MFAACSSLPDDRFLEDIGSAFISSFAKLHPQITDHPDINHKSFDYLEFMRKYMDLVVVEYLHALLIFDYFVQGEQSRIKAGCPPAVHEHNLTYVFVCTLLIASKVSRDTPYKNKYWSEQLGLPLDILNASEITVLRNIDYNVRFKDHEFEHMSKIFVKL